MIPLGHCGAEKQHPHTLSQDGAAEVSQLLRSQGRAFLRVSGKSMLPWVRPGDIVCVRIAVPGAIMKGDLVLFRRGASLCLHRAIQVIPGKNGGPENSLVLAKGDAVQSADDAVSASDVLGTAHFLYRRGKEIALKAAWRRSLARILAAVSPLSRQWYPIVCRMKRALLPGIHYSRDAAAIPLPRPFDK